MEGEVGSNSKKTVVVVVETGCYGRWKHRIPTVNERCKILRSLNTVYVSEIVLLLVPRLKILGRRGLSYFGNSTVPLCFSKIPKYDKPLLHRIFRRGTNNNTISRHKPCSKIEVSYSAHSQLAFDASLLFTDCSAIATATCDLRAAALLLFEAITTSTAQPRAVSLLMFNVSMCVTRDASRRG